MKLATKEHLYCYLPIFLQQIICNYMGWKISKKRYSRNFFKILDLVIARKNECKNKNEKTNIPKLKKQLILAYNNTEYYKKLFDELKFNPNNFNSFNELEVFPIQTKNNVKENITKIINTNIKNIEVSHTSGTTGGGLIFHETIESINERWAIWWRYRFNHGISFDLLSAHFGGRSIVPKKQNKPPFWRSSKSTNQIMFSMYHLNDKSVINYVNELNRKKIKWIHGYPSTISYMAHLMIEKNININYKIKYITIGAENLLENQINIIKKAFGVCPIQHYGLAEPVANISQCVNGKLHVDEDYSYVELIPVKDEINKYKIIGTSLINDATFFLRYDTNDIVTLSGNQCCECGNSGRIISKIDGRKEDFIVQKNGSKIGRMDHIFKDMVNVIEAQIKQLANGEVIFSVVRNNKFSTQDQKALKNEIEKRIDVDYTIEYVNSISRTDSGKLRFVTSEL